MAIDWHYRRADLAQQYLDEFDSGTSDIVALFAKRRMGKTEFVIRDMLPEALDRGYTTLVVDFWTNKADPEACILSGIKNALVNLPIAKKRRLLQLQKVEGSLGLRSNVSAEMGVPSMDTLDDAFRLILRAHTNARGRFDGKVLFFLDEVQHLATNVAFENTTAALRTFIDKNRPWLKVIMTGSSQDNLQRLFRRTKAPFYNMTQMRQFPDLGAGFVKYMLDCFVRSTNGKRLNFTEAVSKFRELDKNPYKFQGLVKIMLQLGLKNFDEGWRHACQVFEDAEDYDKIWKKLKPADQVVFKLLLPAQRDRLHGLYSDDTLAYVAKELGVSHVGKSTIQNSLERLRKLGLVANLGHGEWHFEDADFRDWVQENGTATI